LRSSNVLKDFELPRVLVVSNGCVSGAHGTGTVLMRHFSAYPNEKLANAYLFQMGTPGWNRCWRFYSDNARQPHRKFLVRGAIRAYNLTVSHLGVKQLYFHRALTFKQEIEQIKAFEPELIYSVANTESALALVNGICQSIPTSVPLIQYFMDFFEHGVGLRCTRYLRAVVRRADEIWALTDAIVETISPFAARHNKRVRIQPGFHLNLPKMNRAEIRTADDPRFRCVIIGNFWLLDIVPYLRRVWNRLQRAIPNLPPIQWYCPHESGASKLVDQLGTLEPEIVAMKSLESRELERVLMDSDLAIVPFNLKDNPEHSYAKYSLPSRLADLAASGVPMFCIAGSATPLARFVVSNDIGVVASGEDENSLTEKLKALIEAPALRYELSSRARAFAECHFDLDVFQHDLYGRLASFVGKHTILQRNAELAS
jgi:glycosyltransferase involved in cell wall biosynthesis